MEPTVPMAMQIASRRQAGAASIIAGALVCLAVMGASIVIWRALGENDPAWCRKIACASMPVSGASYTGCLWRRRGGLAGGVDLGDAAARLAARCKVWQGILPQNHEGRLDMKRTSIAAISLAAALATALPGAGRSIIGRSHAAPVLLRWRRRDSTWAEVMKPWYEAHQQGRQGHPQD